MTVKCNCGNKGCTTELQIQKPTGGVNLVIVHKEKELPKFSEQLFLDANGIVNLIQHLKQALVEIA